VRDVQERSRRGVQAKLPAAERLDPGLRLDRRWGARRVNWLEAILSRIADLWPFTRVMPWQRGVRTTFVPFKGVRVTVLEPGIARHLWWFDAIVSLDVQEDSVNLPTQSVTTKDGAAVTFSASFTYEITDVQAALFNVKEFTSSLQDLGLMHLAERVRDGTWDELLGGQKELERSLKGTLETRARHWGVKITRVGITDLVKARQFRHFGELSTG
jgi:regulator of protease activity HflC (stomatin/prohibitin superfamily)